MVADLFGDLIRGDNASLRAALAAAQAGGAEPSVTLCDDEVLIEWPGEIIISLSVDGIGCAVRIGEKFEPFRDWRVIANRIRALSPPASAETRGKLVDGYWVVEDVLPDTTVFSAQAESFPSASAPAGATPWQIAERQISNGIRKHGLVLLVDPDGNYSVDRDPEAPARAPSEACAQIVTDAIEALERGSTTAPVVESLRGLLALYSQSGKK